MKKEDRLFPLWAYPFVALSVFFSAMWMDPAALDKYLERLSRRFNPQWWAEWDADIAEIERYRRDDPGRGI